MSLNQHDSSIFLDQQHENPQGTYVVRPQQEKIEFDDDHTEKNDDAKNQRKPLKHYLCCICFPCLPMWARYSCCTLLILFVIFLIIVGILAAIFKMPQVDFNGPTRHPDGLASFIRSNDSLAFSVNFGLQIGVINNNVESITFESIKAIAYYPTAPKKSVGGGVISNVNIKSYGITNFTFPFSINYDPAQDDGYAMLMDIAQKCGLLGGQKQDLTIEYDLVPTVRIAGIGISPIIHQSSNFACPITSGLFTMGLAKTSDKQEEDDEY